MLRCVRWSSEMSDAMGGKKGAKNHILTSIVSKQHFNFGGKVIFNLGFHYKDSVNIKFLLEWVELDIFSKVINEDNIILEPINR